MEESEKAIEKSMQTSIETMKMLLLLLIIICLACLGSITLPYLSLQ